MSRLPILEKTIKQLFAHSGNQCAFPECPQLLVDGDNVIADICHIEAASIGGERYNPNQTDEERRDEGNLILLCPTHHRVTNNEELFTVDIMKKMKIDHEHKFLSDSFKLSNSILKRITNHANNQNNTNNIRNNTGNLTINQIQNYGISNIDHISDMFLSLFNANFPRIHNCAMQAAMRHIKKFSYFLIEVFKKEGIDISEIENAFIDPDMQCIFDSAVQSVARSGSESLITILSRLIIIRIKNWDNENKRILLSDAILSVHKLSENQLNVLTISFLMHDYIKYLSISSWSELNLYFNEAKKFIYTKPSEMDFRHIHSTGCASFDDSMSPSYSQILKNTFPNLFKRNGFQKDVYVNQVTEDNLVCQNIDIGNLLIQLTSNSKLWALTLSSAGIMISAAHYENVTNKTLMLDSYFDAVNV